MHRLDSLEVRDETKHLIQSRAFRSHIPAFQSTRCSSAHSLSPSLLVQPSGSESIHPMRQLCSRASKGDLPPQRNLFVQLKMSSFINTSMRRIKDGCDENQLLLEVCSINSTISVSLLFLKQCERASIEVHSA
jgi:hypothetical protein